MKHLCIVSTPLLKFSDQSVVNIPSLKLEEKLQLFEYLIFGFYEDKHFKEYIDELHTDIYRLELPLFKDNSEGINEDADSEISNETHL